MIKRIMVSLLTALVIISPGSLVLLGLGRDVAPFGYGLIATIPGMAASMVISDNVHAYSAWIAIVLSLCFWTLLILFICTAILKWRAKHASA